VKTYTLWVEGYAMNCDRGGAWLKGSVEAVSFEDACKRLFKNDPNFNPDKLTTWGCRIFDNEREARRAFG
jgi:hypothetical protein